MFSGRIETGILREKIRDRYFAPQLSHEGFLVNKPCLIIIAVTNTLQSDGVKDHVPEKWQCPRRSRCQLRWL